MMALAELEIGFDVHQFFKHAYSLLQHRKLFDTTFYVIKTFFIEF